MYKITEEQRRRYNENRRLKRQAESPEQRRIRLDKRNEAAKERARIGGAALRAHDSEVRLAYVHNKKLEDPDWDNKRYIRSKLKKEQRAAVLAKTLKPGERICSRCKYVREVEDFPITRTGKISTMCRKCNDIVYQKFDTDSISYWKTRAAAINKSAKRRISRFDSTIENAFTSITGEQLYNLWKHQDMKCVYCGIPLTVLITAHDHKIPLSRGGAHNIDNLQFICHNCNVSKFTMTDEEYRRLTQ